MNSKVDQSPYARKHQQAVAIPQGFGRKARAFARQTTLNCLAAVSRKSGKTGIRSLTCHYVFDDQVDQFAALIKSLLRMGEFVDTDTCAKMLASGRRIDGSYFHLSFDDGFRNVIENAIPILEANQIPAILFVPTMYVGGDYSAAREFCFKEDYRDVIEMASWKDLQGLDRNLFTVGAHTRFHPRISTISDRDMLEAEIAGSKGDVESHLGLPCDYLAWPRGKRGDVSAEALEVAKRTQLKMAFSTVRGCLDERGTDPMFVPRHHFEVQWPDRHINFFAKGRMEEPNTRWQT